ncbi:Uncharacterized protein FWK35_00002432 [Aphis craccivora]|uniref:Uncharacterized protein n=1 Tax=Aphis craccivora TaxID=307492 RepID=A0A6G0ZIH1_APHCR|nr:Uncharacterized protein FWK35_00002432 [Aphis craccivora]
MFATNDSLQILTEAKTWYYDDNFNLSPTDFLKLYIIIVIHTYCISIYEEIFDFVSIKLCAKHKLFIDQTHLNFDFEKAVILATLFKATFIICAKVVLEKSYLRLTKNNDEFSHFSEITTLQFFPMNMLS